MAYIVKDNKVYYQNISEIELDFDQLVAKKNRMKQNIEIGLTEIRKIEEIIKKIETLNNDTTNKLS